MNNHKENILKLKDGESYFVSLGEEAGGEIWLKNGTYFLFEVPQYGGEPRFDVYFGKYEIDSMIARVLSWT